MSSIIDKLISLGDRGDVAEMIKEAEKYELESGGIPQDLAGSFAVVLITGYLIQGDFPNARFTYKRLPATIQGSNKSIQCLGEVTKALLRRSSRPALAALKAWAAPESLMGLTKQLTLTIHTLTLRRLSLSYSDISVAEVAKELCVTEAEAVAMARGVLGWEPVGDRFKTYNAPLVKKPYGIPCIAQLSQRALFLETSGPQPTGDK